MASVELRRFCLVRSGDKGDSVDISLIAPTPETYEAIKQQVTAERVSEFYAPLASGPTRRYELPKILALKFVVGGALGGGAAGSLRSDNLGKAYGANLLRLKVELSDDALKNAPDLRHPPLT